MSGRTQTSPSPHQGLEPPPGPVRLAVPSDPRYLRLVRDVIDRVAECIGFDEETRFQIQLALDEAVTNVIRHGYCDRFDCPIEISIEPLAGPRRGLGVTVRDYGKSTDPSCIKSRDLNDLRPGGLGVHIIRSVMDEVEYSVPAEGGMKLRLAKYIRE